MKIKNKNILNKHPNCYSHKKMMLKKCNQISSCWIWTCCTAKQAISIVHMVIWFFHSIFLFVCIKNWRQCNMWLRQAHLLSVKKKNLRKNIWRNEKTQYSRFKLSESSMVEPTQMCHFPKSFFFLCFECWIWIFSFRLFFVLIEWI